MRIIESLFRDKPGDELINLRAIYRDLPEGDPNKIKSSYVVSIDEVKRFTSQNLAADLYFGVCTRKARRPEIEYVSAAYCVWADCDPYHAGISKEEALQQSLNLCVLPPSAIVDSGGGYHLYWFIPRTDELEAVSDVCRRIADIIVGGGAVSDTTRIFRIDSTFNYKEQPPRPVHLLRISHTIYHLSDVLAAGGLDTKIVNKITSGDTRGHKSRSERDWLVVSALIKAGLSDAAIYAIFDYWPIGDKANEASKYLKHTLNSARQKLGLAEGDVATVQKAGFGGIFERNDAYWMATQGGGAIQLSTFCFQPEVLLNAQPNANNASTGGVGDTLVGSIRANGRTWPSVAFPRSAFTDIRSLVKHLPNAEWAWVGPDAAVRSLLPYIVERFRGRGLPRREGTSQLGHYASASGEDVWLGTRQTLTSSSVLDSLEASVVALPTKSARPVVSYAETPPTKEEVVEFFNLVARINTPEVVWPILGWMGACPFKFKLNNGRRFPVLNLFGTRGSGKTSMITQLMQPFFGYEEASTFDCTTTQFVMLSLLGNSRTVPVAFSEYRASHSVEKMLRYLLLAYDTGHDPRGRPDQSVIDYALDAPFSIDGEDAISDAAARERIIQVNLTPEAILENTGAFAAWNKLIRTDLKRIGTAFIQDSLDVHPVATWAIAEQVMSESFPATLPDRVRKNFTTAVLGLLRFEQFARKYDAELPEIRAEFIRDVFTSPISALVNPETGRTQLIVDVLVEEIINHQAMMGGFTDQFMSRYDQKDNTIWFQLSTAYNWWVRERQQRRQPVLEMTAVKAQLKERTYNGSGPQPGQYVLKATQKAIDGRTYFCYGINLEAALNTGLDVPATAQQLVFKLKGVETEVK